MTTALERVGAAYPEKGITTFHDLGVGFYDGDEELLTYQAALESGGVGQRVYGYLRAARYLDESREPSRKDVAGVAGHPRFEVARAKLMCDVSIPERAGFLSHPYLCDPESRGVMVWSGEELAVQVVQLHEAGWQARYTATVTLLSTRSSMISRR